MKRLTAALALLVISVALPATAATPSVTVQPEGVISIVVLRSDGMTMLPVTGGVLPLVCEVTQ